MLETPILRASTATFKHDAEVTVEGTNKALQANPIKTTRPTATLRRHFYLASSVQ